MYENVMKMKQDHLDFSVPLRASSTWSVLGSLLQFAQEAVAVHHQGINVGCLQVVQKVFVGRPWWRVEFTVFPNKKAPKGNQ